MANDIGFDEFETPSFCPNCERYIPHESGWVDHYTPGCDQRGRERPTCDCAAKEFCCEGCADQFHEEGD